MTYTFLLDALKFFRTHFSALALIVLPFTISIELFTMVYQQSVDVEESFALFAFPVFVHLLVYPVYAVGIVFYLSYSIQGQYLSASQAWALGIQHWPKYFLLSLILTIAIGFGFAMLVLPGIFFAVKFAFSEFELLLKDRGVGDSLNVSWQETSDYFWLLLTGGLILTIVVYGPFLVLGEAFDAAGIAISGLDSLARVVESVLMVLYTIFAFRVYDYARQAGGDSDGAD